MLIQILGVLIYFIYGAVSSHANMIFISVVLMGAFDFWVVKNVTGRKLVGLRWWQDFDDDGKEEYIFESHDDGNFKPNIVDSATFWNSQIALALLWSIIAVLDLITFKFYWMACSISQAGLYSFNLWAFYQCRGDHQKKLSDLKTQGFNSLINNQQFKDVSTGFLQNTLDSFMKQEKK